jgi:hypothetical protein
VSGQLTVNGALLSNGQGEVVLRRAGDDPAGDAAILGQAAGPDGNFGLGLVEVYR